MNTQESNVKMIPGGIMFALMSQRKELLTMTMTTPLLSLGLSLGLVTDHGDQQVLRF